MDFSSFNFDEIRPYRDNEAHEALIHLVEQPQLVSMIPVLFPHVPAELIVEKLKTIQTIDDFQRGIIHEYVENLQKKTTDGVVIDGRDNIDLKKAYIYISNHRDIILDSAFLNSNFFNYDIPRSEIGIGDNLLIYPWIKMLVRLNRSFIVKRGLPVRQQFEALKLMSAYIRNNIVNCNQSVWIAQREGRAKDSNDLTQEAILKMFNVSGDKSLIENTQELSLCPLTLSYEYDPCDYLKAKEFQMKRDNADFKKSPSDDLINMCTGLQGWKGHVVLYLSGNINDEIGKIGEQTTVKTEQFVLLAQLIDKHIHSHYTIFANNKVAYDKLFGDRFRSEYTEQEKENFEEYLQQQLDKIDLDDKDVPFLHKKILEMYANPLVNKLKALGE